MPTLDSNTIVRVAGTIGRTRIMSQYSPEEIDEMNASATKTYKEDRTRPYTLVALDNPQVIPADAAAGLSAEEQFIQSKISQTKKNREPHPNGPQLWLRNKSKDSLPSVGVLVNDNGQQVVEGVDLEGELARGVPVMVLARAFNATMGDGTTFDAIIIRSREDIAYAAANTGAFEKAGFAVRGNFAPRPVTPVAVSAPVAPPQEIPAPTEQPISAPPVNLASFTTQQPQAQAGVTTQQPQQPQAPVQQQQYQAPVQQQYQQMPPQQAPQVPQQPQVSLPPQQQGSPFADSPVTPDSMPSSQFAQPEQPQVQPEQPNAGITYDAPTEGSWPAGI